MKIRNDFSFTNLDKYDFYYIIRDHGKEVYRGKIENIHAAPGKTVTTGFLNGIPKEKQTTGDVRIEFYAAIKTAEPFLPAGTVIAREQTYVHTFYKKEATAQQPATSKEEGNLVAFSGPDFKATFDKQSGLLTSYLYKKHEYILNGQGPRPFFWRAPTDNDYGNGGPKREQIWKQSSKNFNVADVTTTTDGNKTVLTVNYLLAAGNLYIMKYTIYPDGVVHAGITFTSTDMKAADTEVSEATLMATFTPGQDAQRLASSKLNVPRIGVRFHLPSDMNQVEYFGRGPGENYIDRNASSFVDLYRTTADQMYTNNYVRPQENGHRTDTRWVELTRKGGKGLLIRADSTIGFNALRNSVEDFDSEEAISRPRQWTNFTPEEVANHNEEKAKNVIRRMTHVNDITPRNFVEVCIDMKQQGIAGYDSWGDRPLPEHTLPANKEYHWGFTLMPVK